MGSSQRDPVREGFWREAVERQAASGLSVREFCRREKLAETSFYAWRRTIGERNEASRSPEQPAFVPAVIQGELPSDGAITLELAGGRALRLPASTSAERLAQLILALESQVSQ